MSELLSASFEPLPDSEADEFSEDTVFEVPDEHAVIIPAAKTAGTIPHNILFFIIYLYTPFLDFKTLIIPDTLVPYKSPGQSDTAISYI